MCDVCLSVCNAIGELTKDEGDIVTILSRNQKTTSSNYSIDVVGGWTYWKTLRFRGDTTLEALEKAVASKEGVV